MRNFYLRDSAIPGIALTDCRNIEIVATGLPIHRGIPLAVDVTLVSPLHTDGTVWTAADKSPGKAIRRAETSKQGTYPELVDSSILRLSTVAGEVGGRWSEDAARLIQDMAFARSREAPRKLRSSAVVAWRKRWWTMLSVATQDTLAATMVNDRVEILDAADGEAPELTEVLVEAAAGNIL